MKTFIQNYSYSKAGKTITLTDFTATRPVLLERILMIIDATLGVIVYNIADSTVTTATVSSNNVITLAAVPGASADSDKMTVIYDTLPGDPQSSTLQGGYQSSTTVLSTGLNSLANNANSSASAAFDNSTTRYQRLDMRLTLATQGAVRSSGAVVAVYMITRFDGSVYDDVNEITAELVAVFPLDAVTTARVATRRNVTIPPENVEFFARNLTGQAFAASGNVIAIRPYYGTAM